MWQAHWEGGVKVRKRLTLAREREGTKVSLNREENTGRVFPVTGSKQSCYVSVVTRDSVDG